MRQDHDLSFSLKYENVAWYENGTFKLLNRRTYPVRTEFIRCSSYKEVAKAISARFCEFHTAIAAAICAMALAAYETREQEPEKRKDSMKKVADILTECRPALSEDLKRFIQPTLTIAEEAIDAGKEVDKTIMDVYVKNLEQVYESYAKIGKHMADRCPDYGNILLIAPEEIYAAMLVRELNKQGKEINIFVPEQRPTCVGSRLVAATISEMGGEATIISDSSIAFIMKRKRVKAYFNCTNSIYEDGYGVSLIGGFQGALSANYWGIPNYLVGIPIKGNIKSSVMALEEYRPAEVLSILGHQVAHRGSLAYAPSHDVTPPEICDGVITDKGVFKATELSAYLDGSSKSDSENTKEDSSAKAKDEISTVSKDSKNSNKGSDASSKNDVKSDSKNSKESKDDKSQTKDNKNQSKTYTKEEPKDLHKTEDSKKSDKSDSKEDQESADDFNLDDIKIPDFSKEKLGKLEFNQIASDGIRPSSNQSLGLLNSDSANIKLDSMDDASKASESKKAENLAEIKNASNEFNSGVSTMKELSSKDQKSVTDSSISASPKMPNFSYDDEANDSNSENLAAASEKSKNKESSHSLFGDDDEPLPDFVKSTFSSSSANSSSLDFLSQFDDNSDADDFSMPSASPSASSSNTQKDANLDLGPKTKFSPTPSSSSTSSPSKEDDKSKDKEQKDKEQKVLMVFSDGTKIRSFDDLDESVRTELQKLNTPLEKLDVKMVEKMQKEAWRKQANSAMSKAGTAVDLSKVKKPNVKVNVSQVSSGYVPSADEFAKARQELEKMAGEIMATSTDSTEEIPKRKVDQEKKSLIIDTSKPKKKAEVVADLGLSSPDPASSTNHQIHPNSQSSAWKTPQNKPENQKQNNKRGIFGNLFTKKNDAVIETSFSDIDLNPYDEYEAKNQGNQSTDVSLNDAMDDIPEWQVSMLQKASED